MTFASLNPTYSPRESTEDGKIRWAIHRKKSGEENDVFFHDIFLPMWDDLYEHQKLRNVSFSCSEFSGGDQMLF